MEHEESEDCWCEPEVINFEEAADEEETDGD